MSDRLHKFLFEGAPMRGMLVLLESGWQELLARRAGAAPWAPALRDLVGEMTAASVLMHANLKFQGALILQIQGDGPVSLAVAEARGDLGYRATATVKGPVGEAATLPEMVNLQGQGRCAITLDAIDRAPGQQPYQGVVPLHGDRREPLMQVAQVLEHYMLQSEQLDTRLVLAANAQRAAGLLIQRLPLEGIGNLQGQGKDVRNEDTIGQSEDFHRIALLAATLQRDELLALDEELILRRLFWQERITRFEPLAPRFACTCSGDRVRGMLRGLGRDEIEGIIAEREMVEVGCEFCGLQYRFDAVDVGAMFTPGGKLSPGSGVLN
jgi:molecular chaperone Hsp33